MLSSTSMGNSGLVGGVGVPPLYPSLHSDSGIETVFLPSSPHSAPPVIVQHMFQSSIFSIGCSEQIT